MAMNILQLAGVLPRDPQFRKWLSQFYGREVTEEMAVRFIREMCGIESRRELETDDRAEKIFHEQIRKKFIAWRERQEEHA